MMIIVNKNKPYSPAFPRSISCCLLQHSATRSIVQRQGNKGRPLSHGTVGNSGHSSVVTACEKKLEKCFENKAQCILFAYTIINIAINISSLFKEAETFPIWKVGPKGLFF